MAEQNHNAPEGTPADNGAVTNEIDNLALFTYPIPEVDNYPAFLVADGVPLGEHPPARVCGVHGASNDEPAVCASVSCARATQLSSHSTTQQNGSLRQT